MRRAIPFRVVGGGWDILGFRFGGFWCIVRHPNLVCATAHQQPPASLTAVLMRAAWESFLRVVRLNGSSPDVMGDVITAKQRAHSRLSPLRAAERVLITVNLITRAVTAEILRFLISPSGH